jgi:hypothetical protein
MKKNMSIVDRQIRIAIASVIVILFFTDVIGGMLGLILLILSGVLFLTSLFGFCPLYALAGVHTSNRKPEE